MSSTIMLLDRAQMTAIYMNAPEDIIFSNESHFPINASTRAKTPKAPKWTSLIISSRLLLSKFPPMESAQSASPSRCNPLVSHTSNSRTRNAAPAVHLPKGSILNRCTIVYRISPKIRLYCIQNQPQNQTHYWEPWK